MKEWGALMGRWQIFLGGALLLAGCPSRLGETPTLNSKNGTGTTTTAGTGGGQLLDGAGGQDASCCVKDKIDPFEGPSWFVITGDTHL
ncbi:MAG TPA: hypothetical protein DCQ04_13710, partial [Actinobacteria bacterium]|nr:hypothetical protein [Actinomycetota bacterium]